MEINGTVTISLHRYEELKATYDSKWKDEKLRELLKDNEYLRAELEVITLKTKPKVSFIRKILIWLQ